jgi:hypothetical protein
MNSSDQPTRQSHRPLVDPMDYVFRRLSSLAVVGGAITGLVSAGLLESRGLPGPIALGAGLVAFVAATSLATGLAAGRRTPHRRNDPL